MQPAFDNLIQRYIDDKIGLTEDFLPAPLGALLKEKLLSLYNAHELLSAGTGNDLLVHHDKLVRSDLIYWLDRSHDDDSENSFLSHMDSFVSYLNSTCYTGITGYEFHFALYEKGSFYKKHLDQFKHDKSRAYTMILYLNTDWMPGDGGELCIYQVNHVQTIAPTNGTCVFFKSSELVHEVLLTRQPRLSITGWLKTD